MRDLSRLARVLAASITGFSVPMQQVSGGGAAETGAAAGQVLVKGAPDAV